MYLKQNRRRKWMWFAQSHNWTVKDIRHNTTQETYSLALYSVRFPEYLFQCISETRTYISFNPLFHQGLLSSYWVCGNSATWPSTLLISPMLSLSILIHYQCIHILSPRKSNGENWHLHTISSLACLAEMHHFRISQTHEQHPSLTHWTPKERKNNGEKKVIIIGSFLSSRQWDKSFLCIASSNILNNPTQRSPPFWIWKLN